MRKVVTCFTVFISFSSNSSSAVESSFRSVLDVLLIKSSSTVKLFFYFFLTYSF